jgi:iron complex transport system substrate-binding protein
VSGRDSLVSSLLTETGLFNAAGDLGVGSGGYASLEAIVNAKPDFLLVSEEGSRAEDDGRAFLLHPALERFYPLARRIVIPERLTVCGGVMLADALDVLVAELKRVGR